jgi:hypothetical protein
LETPYFQAARFPNKKKAGEVYFPLQKLLYETRDECDISVYRLQITEGWHVVVLGEKPPGALHVQIEALLTQGTLVSLSDRPDVLRFLQHRRAQATRLGPWVEGHYRSSEEEQ